MDAHEAYWFVNDHPKLAPIGLSPSMEVMVMKVNPKDGMVSPHPELNTKTEVWLETIIYSDGPEGLESVHDWGLDTGGGTYEEAIISLAELVKEKYGDYEYDN